MVFSSSGATATENIFERAALINAALLPETMLHWRRWTTVVSYKGMKIMVYSAIAVFIIITTVLLQQMKLLAVFRQY